jgi:hypothetical protein
VSNVARINVQYQRAGQVLDSVAARARNPAPARAKVPKIARAGRQSLMEAVTTRRYINREGVATVWQEPAHLQGRPIPDRIRAGEQIMWDALTGRGPGTVTRIGSRGVEIGANDLVIRVLAAQIGNRIVSGEEYLPFVTGRFTERTTPARSRFSKPSLWRTGRAPRQGPRRAISTPPKGFDPRAARLAVWWLLGLSLDLWLSYDQIRTGLLVPPKNINAWTPGVLTRISDTYGRYIVTGKA